MKHTALLTLIICLLASCERYSCPMCGGHGTEFTTDTIDKDIALPVLMNWGEKTNAGVVTIIAYRDDAVLRETQRMRRTLEICTSCGYVANRYYETIFYDYKRNIRYSKVRYFVEDLQGNVLAEIKEDIGAVVEIE